ncbi:nitrite reductase [Paenibacillus flagellatus]|nr:nitrite reductase [Paenibacillus flagellatus]
MKIAIAPLIGVGGNRFTAEQWRTVGSVLGDEAHIEFTPFRQLYADVEEERFDDVRDRLAEKGLDVYPAGFFSKSLIACQFCRGAEEAGLSTALKLNELVAGRALPHPLKVGYAGCANATSEPLFQDIGIVKMKDRFDVYLGGDGKSIRASVGQLWLSGLTEAELLETIPKLLAHFRDNGKKKERFSRFVGRMTMERLREAVR